MAAFQHLIDKIEREEKAEQRKKEQEQKQKESKPEPELVSEPIKNEEEKSIQAPVQKNNPGGKIDGK